MLQYCYYYSLPLYYCAIFNSLDAAFRVSNSLDPDQAQHFVGPDLGPNCLQRLPADIAGKELNTKQLLDTFWLKAPTFSIWLKCWLQQILSQGKPWIGRNEYVSQRESIQSLLCPFVTLSTNFISKCNSIGRSQSQTSHIYFGPIGKIHNTRAIALQC